MDELSEVTKNQREHSESSLMCFKKTFLVGVGDILNIMDVSQVFLRMMAILREAGIAQ